MFGAKPDSCYNVNVDTHMEIALVGKQGTAHVTDGEFMANLSRINHALSLKN